MLRVKLLTPVIAWATMVCSCAGGIVDSSDWMYCTCALSAPGAACCGAACCTGCGCGSACRCGGNRQHRQDNWRKAEHKCQRPAPAAAAPPAAVGHRANSHQCQCQCQGGRAGSRTWSRGKARLCEFSSVLMSAGWDLTPQKRTQSILIKASATHLHLRQRRPAAAHGVAAADSGACRGTKQRRGRVAVGAGADGAAPGALPRQQHTDGPLQVVAQCRYHAHVQQLLEHALRWTDNKAVLQCR